MTVHRHQAVEIAVAMCALADGTNTGVVAFEGRVGQMVACPGDHAVDVAHHQVVERDERREPRPVEQATPSLEEDAHPLLCRVHYCAILRMYTTCA